MKSQTEGKKEKIKELAIEYALLKTLGNKDYEQIKRLKELEKLR